MNVFALILVFKNYYIKILFIWITELFDSLSKSVPKINASLALPSLRPGGEGRLSQAAGGTLMQWKTHHVTRSQETWVPVCKLQGFLSVLTESDSGFIRLCNLKIAAIEDHRCLAGTWTPYRWG